MRRRALAAWRAPEAGEDAFSTRSFARGGLRLRQERTAFGRLVLRALRALGATWTRTALRSRDRIADARSGASARADSCSETLASRSHEAVVP